MQAKQIYNQGNSASTTYFLKITIDTVYEPRQANLYLRAFRHDKF